MYGHRRFGIQKYMSKVRFERTPSYEDLEFANLNQTP